MDPEHERSTGVTATTATLSASVSKALDFDALYREARDDVFAYAATLLRDAAAAEDVTAQAFERAFRKRSRYSARRGTPRAWLFGIARKAELPGPLEDPAPAGAAELAVRRDAVRAALSKLPARERELIALKYHADLS